MRIELNRPELEKFIDEQVGAGCYPSAQAAVEAAIERMMLSAEELDDETAEAINRAEQQIDRGEGIDFNEFAAHMRKKIKVG
ncbi:MAG TPA: hypothetical protein VFC78_18505 [Tepidisphaeraceae bacterium]|nr:hypothetical protein [Tepidisphaeraceae bacterium]